MNRELIELARPFPSQYVKQVQGDNYVPHGIVEQRLVHIFGTTPETEILREIYEADGVLSGCVMRMTVPGFKPVEEAGECDNPRAKTNGAKLKSAASDAYKRCAMRLTCGLHLWIGQDADYFLFDQLTKEVPDTHREPDGNGVQGEPATGAAHVQPPHETPVQTGQAEEANPDNTGKGASSADPVATAKRIELKQLCKNAKPKLVAEKLAHDAFGKNLSELSVAELDELIEPMTGKVSA